MYWHRDARYRAGGFSYCAERQREKERERYDSDVVYRVTKQLRHASLMRRATIEGMESRLDTVKKTR